MISFHKVGHLGRWMQWGRRSENVIGFQKTKPHQHKVMIGGGFLLFLHIGRFKLGLMLPERMQRRDPLVHRDFYWPAKWLRNA